MANLAVLASGNGSNFQAIAEAVGEGGHTLCCLICDRPDAYALVRAEHLGVPSHVVSYAGRKRTEAEKDILGIFRKHDVDIVALAGFMRLLTPLVVDAYAGRIINIHPSLLPKYPGTNAIAESFHSPDTEVGITVHTVDHGMDSGPIIVQKSLQRISGETLQELEQRIHELEHRTYPAVVIEVLNRLNGSKQSADQTRRTQ